MEDRSHLLKSLKVLFPDKSSYRIKQGEIPLILYSFECYRRKITEVKLTAKYFLSNKYLKAGKKQVIRVNGKKTFIQKKPASLVYTAGYIKKKFDVRSYVDILLIGLALNMENPTRLVIASQRFQHNKRLSRLTAEEIKREWIRNYQDAEITLGMLTEDRIEAIKQKKGKEWQKVFSDIEITLQRVNSLEIIAGLTFYFMKKNKTTKEKTHTVDEENTFLFDTLFQFLKFGGITSPINLKRVSIPKDFFPETISVVNYLVRKAQEEEIEPSSLLFYYALSNPTPEVENFFRRIEKPFEKRKIMWQLIYIRNNRQRFGKQMNLPEPIRKYLDNRILLTKRHILEGKNLSMDL
jgi:hypothetical protein